MGKNILMLIGLEDHYIDRIKQAAPDCNFIFAKPNAVTQEQIQAANVILGSPPAEMLQGCTQLDLICLSSAGANNYCEKGVLPKGTLLTNATGAYGLMIGEWLVGMLLNIYNYFPQYKEHQHQNRWERLKSKHHTVSGSTVLVVGAGDIGGRFARHVKNLGAYTIGLRRSSLKKTRLS